MTYSLTLVIYMAIVTWLLTVAASLIRANAWTPAGLRVAFGNRANLPEPSALAGRAERTARNTLENFVLFTAIALVAHLAAPGNARVAQGAEIFFWARMVYVPVYYMGVPFLRTGVWAVSIAGMGVMISAVL